MTPSRETPQLIAALAQQAGSGGGELSADFKRLLPLACGGSLTLAAVLSFQMFGTWQALSGALADRWFYQKLICMAVLALGGGLILNNLAQPGRARIHPALLAPGLVLLALGAFTDSSGLSLAGRSPFAVPTCLGAIVALSLPGLAIFLFILRKAAASTRPVLTGATAGLLAGALGGAAYALVCKNDGGLFIAVWYGAAISITTILGAAVGRRALAW